MRPRYAAIPAGLLLALGACANPTFVPGPGKAMAEFGPDSGRCHLYAEETRPDTSFEASGSPKAVAIESGAMLLIGGIATAVHDNETYNNCMRANNWLDKNEVAAANVTPQAAAQPVAAFPVVPQPVMQSALPTPGPMPMFSSAAVDPARAQQTARAQQAAHDWLIAQGILNGPHTRQQHSLYAALCRAGDQSSCVMASLQ